MFDHLLVAVVQPFQGLHDIHAGVEFIGTAGMGYQIFPVLIAFVLGSQFQLFDLNRVANTLNALGGLEILVTLFRVKFDKFGESILHILIGGQSN